MLLARIAPQGFRGFFLLSGRGSHKNGSQITPLGRVIDSLLNRKNVGLNAKEFAEKIGVHPSTITKLRRGGIDLSENLLKDIVEVFPEFYSDLKHFEGKANDIEVEDANEFEIDADGYPIKGQVKLEFDKVGSSISFSDGSHPKYIRRVLEELSESQDLWSRLEN